MADDADVLSALDPILAAEDTSGTPWVKLVHAGSDDVRVYVPAYDLARRLLSVPISEGRAEEQETGRVAKALDAWIAHELRRAGFPEGSAWPRRRRPRALPGDLAQLEALVTEAQDRVDEFEDRLKQYEAKARKKGLNVDPPSLYRVRPAIEALRTRLPGGANADILGRFYVKQVDVVASSWQRGPEVLVSTKTQFSSYLNNKNNRYEEAVGEATNLRDRYPMAAMGFAFLVRSNIHDERGAFVYLRNQLARLRRPDGPFDATMLMVADWDDDALVLAPIEDVVEPLTARQFFEDLLNAVMNNTPVDLHQMLRLRKQGEPEGGMPPLDEGTMPEEAEELGFGPPVFGP
jgi:hypothetical protein